MRLITLGATLFFPILVKNSSGVPINADAAPTVRIYGPTAGAGVMANGSKTCSLMHSGSVSNVVDNGSGACRVTTSSAHGLSTGQRVTIASVGGATGVNGTHVVTVINSTTFDCDGSTFGGAYTSGGTWNVTGLYYFTADITSGDSYQSGKVYHVLADYAISSSAQGQLHHFQAA